MQFNAVGYAIFNIPGYFFFAGIGITIALSVFILLNFAKGYRLSTSVCILPVIGICTIVAARFFGCLTGAYSAIGEGRQIDLKAITDTGVVFYGGLIGLLVSCEIYIRLSKIDPHIIDLVVVVVPLFHAIARIGCFAGGCCFGKEYSGFISIQYTTIICGEVVTSQRIPIQFIEAIFNFGLFIYLLFLLCNRNWKKIVYYVIIYFYIVSEGFSLNFSEEILLGV